MRLSRTLKLLLPGMAITGFALFFIVSQVNFALFAEAWATARYIYIIPCVFFLLAGLVTRAFRWQVLLNADLRLNRTFHIMNIAYLVNGVLPLRIGEVARAYLASQGQGAVPMMQSFSSIIVERLLDLLAIVLMTLLALMVGPVPDEIRAASAFAAIVAIGGFLALVLLSANRNFLQRLLHLIMERLPALRRLPLEDGLNTFLDGLTPITRPRMLLMALGWTAISWILSVIAGYLLMFAFFEDGSLTATMLYIAAAAFAIALPAVPGNVGTYEASILLALTAMGYEQSGAALAFAVMVHAVNVFVHASTGVIGFIQEGISLTQLRQRVQRVQPHTKQKALHDGDYAIGTD